jgi:hypothetical protein
MARVSDKVPLAHRTKSITSTDVGSPRESEAEDSSVSSTTRSLKERIRLLKSRRRRQGHMSNFSQERVNSRPQLVFRRRF